MRKCRKYIPTRTKVRRSLDKIEKMKNIRTTINKELEKLDLRWRNLPVRMQMRYVLYLFAFYLLMGVGMLVKVFYDLGRGDEVAISHIELPKVIQHESSVSDSVTNPKYIRNGRKRE